MEARNLRIGSLVKRYDNLYVVSSIKKNELELDSIDSDRHVNYCTYDELSPIPLTEEIHNMFGVKKNGFNNFEYKLPTRNNLCITVVHTHEYVMLRQGDGKPYDDDVVSIWNKDVTRRDMYVHEWQNLYHSLTGEELIIKIEENENKSSV